MTIRNRELSQFGSFIYVDNSNRSIGITTEETPYVGIGTTNATSKFHVVGNAHFSGIVTALSFSGNATSASFASTAGIATHADYSTNAGISTYATSSGISTYATNAGISTSVIGGISSVTQLNVTGVSTLGIVTAGNIFSTGIITATNFSGDGSLLTNVKGILEYFGSVITSSTTTLTSTDVNTIILVDTSSTKTINLPAGVGIETGSLFRIVDAGTGANSSGNAATYNINIVPNASDQINGAGAGVTFAIDVNGGLVELIWAGSTYDWRIVG